MTSGPTLTVLVPVRNGEHQLPAWLASVAEYADDVIALDDGSTDATRRILDESDLVSTVLANPRRPTYVGWDDRENRQRLVYAALAARAEWVLFLDADERLHAQDGRALREFVDAEALTGFAYGFEIFRMVEDEHHFDPQGMWVYRLFHCKDVDGPLPPKRLHFVPVPEGVDRARWLQTTIRIQHFGSLTETRRRDRYDKYSLTDPDREFQPDYDHLLEDPGMIERWRDREPELPVVVGASQRYADLLPATGDPSLPVAITAVVIAQNDSAVIDRSIAALVEQEVSDGFEVILVDSGQDDTVARVAERHPSVRCVHLPYPALPGEARNAGLWMARGEYVTFPGSHVWLTEGSLQARLDAHDEGWGMVTGPVVNGNSSSRGGWGSYFLDHSTQMPGRPSAEFKGVPGHASYVTRDLRRIGGFPEDMRAGEDTVANRKLHLAGTKSYFCSRASFHHASPCRSMGDVMRHHYQRGRAMGRIIAVGEPRRFSRARIRSTRAAARNRLRRVRDAVSLADGELRARYRSVRWHVLGGVVAAFAGSVRELARPGTEPGEDQLELPVDAGAGTGPLLAIGGRPGTHGSGLLGTGAAADAARRLATFTRYARHETEVLAALAPIVTSATITSEFLGTNTLEMGDESVTAYLIAARGIRASLVLQIQPGRADLVDQLDRWDDFLVEPDVGVLFDLRPHLARAGQVNCLGSVVEEMRARFGADPPPIKNVHVRGVTRNEVPASVVVVEAVDLRQLGSLYPHDLFAARPDTVAVVYD